VLLLGGIPVVVAAPKTDVVILKDGSRLIGEVKSVGRGRLVLGTDAADTIYIQWDLVKQLVSNQIFRLETRSGTLYFGSLGEPTRVDNLRIQTGSQNADVPLMDVVRISRVGLETSDCWSGDISAGYSLASANRQSQFNFDLHVQCRTPNVFGKLSAFDITTGTSEEPSSQNAGALLEMYHLFPDRWFVGGLLGGERNDQLGVESRISAGAGGGRYLLQTDTQIWRAVAGIVESREQDADSPGATHSTQGMMQLNFDWFRLGSPELDFSSSVSVFPYLTESGRWRGSGKVSLKWEIASNFFLRAQLMGDFDTHPGNGGTTKTDYNISTSFGYSVNQ
jgi:hypothetical protein